MYSASAVGGGSLMQRLRPYAMPIALFCFTVLLYTHYFMEAGSFGYDMSEYDRVTALQSKMTLFQTELSTTRTKLDSALAVNSTLRNILKELSYANTAFSSMADMEGINQKEVEKAVETLERIRNTLIVNYVPKLSDLKQSKAFDVLRSLPSRVARCNAPGRIALVFEGGPYGESGCTNVECTAQQRILDALSKLRIRASFFVSGVRLRKWPLWADRAAQAGHHVGSHGYLQRGQNSLSEDDLRTDMDNMEIVFKNATGFHPYTFLPTTESLNPSIRKYYELRGYTVVGPEGLLYSHDRSFTDPTELANAIVRLIVERSEVARKGGILVLSNGHQATADALPAIVRTLRDEYEYGFGVLDSCM